MILLSRKVEYGLMALLCLSEAGARGRPMSATCLARQNRVPGALLGKVLQDLMRAGLVVSAAGVYGGYRLRRKPDEISLSSVITAIDGPVHLAGCETHFHCLQRRSCGLRAPLARVRGAVVAPLDRITLADLQEQGHGKHNQIA